MKKKGFTLIELLAVIVILAIIALIATPIVMNVIENSRKGAAERSADNYIDAVETTVLSSRLKGEILEGNYVIQEEDGNLCKLGAKCTDETEIKIDINGKKPSTGTVYIENGLVLDGSIIEFGDYVTNIIDGVSKTDNFGTVLDLFTTTETKVINFIKNQTAGTPTITYNPITGEKCDTQDNKDCFGWYVLEDKGSDYAYVTLIMDRNLGEKVAWCSDETLCKDKNGNLDNSKGPITAVNYLNSLTNNWSVVASLPKREKIGSTGCSETKGSCPTWLYDYLADTTDGTTNKVSGVYGYWTSTPTTTKYAFSVNHHGVVYQQGGNEENAINNSASYGVRPVINVLKDNL